MKTNNLFNYLSLLFLYTLLIFGCRKKAPEGFSADFNVSYNNGGMAPDTVVFLAGFSEADSYDWLLAGGSQEGQQVSFRFTSAGSFYASLTVESGKHTKTQGIDIEINNYPSGGSAMTIVNENGELGTFGVDGDNPFFVPVDTIDADAIGGMDYDDNTKQLYYTGSIKRAFPNGVKRETLFDNSQIGTDQQITDIVIDSDDQRVYFAASGLETQSIASINMNGEDLVFEFSNTFFEKILDITLDAAKDRVYFTSEFSTNINHTILGDVSITYSDNNRKYALVFDNKTKWLYYADEVFDTGGGNTHTNIMRFKPDEYNFSLPDTWPEVIVENASLEPIFGMDISESKQHLYWSDSRKQVIYRLDLNIPQGEREIIFSNVTNPRAIAIGNFEE